MEETKLLKENEGRRYALKGSWLWGALLFLILLLIDQITKIVADVYFVEIAGANERIVLIPNMIELQNRYRGRNGTDDAWACRILLQSG